ncbi:MAG: hypothetical protein AB7G12_07175 [Thermoanaerobaculia bacterium]
MKAQRSPFGSPRHRLAKLSAASVLLAVGLHAAAPSAAAQIVPLSGEIAVSQPDGDFESFANVAANRQGGWGIAWQVESLDFNHPSGRQRRLLRDGEALPGSLLDVPLRYPDLGLDGEGYGVLVGIVERPSLGGFEVDAYCTDIQGLPASETRRVDEGTISPASRVPLAVRVATDTNRNSVVVWQENPRVSGVPPSIFFRRLGANCSTMGGVGSLGSVGVIGRREPHVAFRGDGGFVLVWVEGEQEADLHVRAQLFDREGTAAAPSIVVAPSGRRPSHPTVAVGSAGTFAVVWKSDQVPATSGSGTGISARVFGADGVPLGGELALRSPRAPVTAESAVAALGESFVAVWGEAGFIEQGSAVYGRAFEALAPVGEETVLNIRHTDPGNVRVATLAGNEFVVVWDDYAEGTLPPDVVARRFVLAPQVPGCVAAESALCLGAGRFRITVEWRDYQGFQGVGHAYPLTGDSGLFWFFTDTNMEVLVKVVDACLEFGQYWVYAAATTDVEYTLTAIDTATGRSRSYFNPLGRRSPAITDSAAFAACP